MGSLSMSPRLAGWWPAAIRGWHTPGASCPTRVDGFRAPAGRPRVNARLRQGNGATPGRSPPDVVVQGPRPRWVEERGSECGHPLWERLGARLSRGGKRGMIAGCDCPDLAGVSPTRIASLASAPCRRWSASSGSPACALSRSSAAQKNGLWRVRPGPQRLLRSPGAPGARPPVRRPADRRGVRAAPGRVPHLWRGEARAARLPGRQSPLHQALRVLRRAALPRLGHQRHRRGAAPGVAHGQGARAAVHARAAAARRHARAEGHRHRRGVDPERAHLSDRRQRPPAPAADLVRRHGPLRGQHGCVLHLARRQENRGDSPRGDGHVEAVSHLHHAPTRRRRASCSTSSMCCAT